MVHIKYKNLADLQRDAEQGQLVAGFTLKARQE